MVLKFTEFTKAKDLVEKIMKDTPNENIEKEIEHSTEGMDEDTKRAFYTHLSMLFLNVMLNRLHEFKNGAKEKTVQARQIIISLIK